MINEVKMTSNQKAKAALMSGNLKNKEKYVCC